jgi:pyridoxal phosphate enzyme (YggS family)
MERIRATDPGGRTVADVLVARHPAAHHCLHPAAGSPMVCASIDAVFQPLTEPAVTQAAVLDIATASERLARVHEHIATAAREAGRDPAAVTLVAVSKTFDAEHIRPVLQAGQRIFGENRVQEAKLKWPGLRAEFPDAEVHLIGPLQSNKAREAVELFDCIHTVDRPKIAHTLATEMSRVGRRPPLFVEVNTGEEPQKAGVTPRDARALVELARDELGLPVIGLMCIPPQEEEPAVHFALLAKLAAELGLAKLSMGMSADYETAVNLGATHVRVGSAIFGHRN